MVFTLVTLMAASCANVSDRDGISSEGGADEGSVSGFLEEPLGDLGVEVANVRDADLPFQPLVPDRLGSPLRIVAYSEGPKTAAVAWVFDNPTLGQFAVMERVDDMSEEGLKVEASPVPSPGCTTVEVDDGKGGTTTLERCAFNPSKLITLADGRDALLTAGERFSTVTWIEPLVAAPGVTVDLPGWNLVVEVMGPASGFTRDQAIEAANQIV